MKKDKFSPLFYVAIKVNIKVRDHEKYIVPPWILVILIFYYLTFKCSVAFNKISFLLKIYTLEADKHLENK